MWASTNWLTGRRETRQNLRAERSKVFAEFLASASRYEGVLPGNFESWLSADTLEIAAAYDALMEKCVEVALITDRRDLKEAAERALAFASDWDEETVPRVRAARLAFEFLARKEVGRKLLKEKTLNDFLEDKVDHPAVRRTWKLKTEPGQLPGASKPLNLNLGIFAYSVRGRPGEIPSRRAD